MFDEPTLTPKEKDLLADLEKLNISFEEKDYFRVIMLSIQLTVEIIDALAKRSQDFWGDRVSISDDDLYVYGLSGRLFKKESDRLYIVNNLVHMYEKDEYFTKDDFTEYFNELADLVSLRNSLAHEYYSKPVSQDRMKKCAGYGLEIAKLFSVELEIHAGV